jgi:peptide-methionine (S)-S-oxide reductase
MRRLDVLTGLMASALALALSAAPAPAEERTQEAAPPAAGLAIATFAGGCFWCMEPPFDKLEGVVSTTSGYTGGQKAGATYREVTAGGTGHYEAVRVVYDPQKVSYDKLLDVFWRNVDPLDPGGQFCDRGASYRTAVFAHDTEQKHLATASKQALTNSKRFSKPVVTPILEAGPFWVAEDYHQRLLREEPVQVSVLSLELRPRCPPRSSLGQASGVVTLARPAPASGLSH